MLIILSRRTAICQSVAEVYNFPRVSSFATIQLSIDVNFAYLDNVSRLYLRISFKEKDVDKPPPPPEKNTFNMEM